MRRLKKIRAAIIYDAFIPRRTAAAESEAAGVAADARQVQQALISSGMAAVLMPVDGNIFETITAIKKIKPSVIVNLCESFRGRSFYEAQVAGLIELIGCPYTGNGASALGLCQDKFRAKAVLRASGLPTPQGWLAGPPAAPGAPARNAALIAAGGQRLRAGGEKEIPENVVFPLIVKPNFEDGGTGIYAESVVHNSQTLTAGVSRIVAKYNQPALIEEFIEGREFNVAVIESPKPGRVKVLPLSEISFAGLPPDLPRVVGYEAKWIKEHPFYEGTVPVCPAKNVPEKTAESLRKLALRTWQVMRLRGYARIDFRVSAKGRPYILDVNPNPDPSFDSGLARSLKAEGISWKEFWRGQVMAATKRKKA